MLLNKENQAFSSPRERLRKYFERGDLYFANNTHLSFVCGAGDDALADGASPSFRALFLNHVAARGDHAITCVRAETAASELLREIEERGRNISLFERTIANTVDSVLIFPESPGSFAELGYFSASEEISRKTLVAVRGKHQGNSFITLGPIHAIGRISIFNPTPFTVTEPYSDSMEAIVNKLLGDPKRPYRQRFEKKELKEYPEKQQLAIIDELVDLVGATTELDLQDNIKRIFGRYDVSEVRLLLSILVATGRIWRNDFGDIFAKPRPAPFIEAANKLEASSVKAAWRHAFEELDPAAIEEMGNIPR